MTQYYTVVQHRDYNSPLDLARWLNGQRDKGLELVGIDDSFFIFEPLIDESRELGQRLTKLESQVALDRLGKL